MRSEERHGGEEAARRDGGREGGMEGGRERVKWSSINNVCGPCSLIMAAPTVDLRLGRGDLPTGVTLGYRLDPLCVWGVYIRVCVCVCVSVSVLGVHVLYVLYRKSS